MLIMYGSIFCNKYIGQNLMQRMCAFNAKDSELIIVVAAW